MFYPIRSTMKSIFECITHQAHACVTFFALKKEFLAENVSAGE